MVREARYIYSTVMHVADFTHPRWQLRMVKKIEEGHDDDDDGGVWWGYLSLCWLASTLYLRPMLNTTSKPGS